MCEVRGVIRWPKYIVSPSQKWSDEEAGGRTNHQKVLYNDENTVKVIVDAKKEAKRDANHRVFL